MCTTRTWITKNSHKTLSHFIVSLWFSFFSSPPHSLIFHSFANGRSHFHFCILLSQRQIRFFYCFMCVFFSRVIIVTREPAICNWNGECAAKSFIDEVGTFNHFSAIQNVLHCRCSSLSIQKFCSCEKKRERETPT